MVPKYVIDVLIIWLNDNIYSRNTWFPTTDVQTQNIGKLRYANRHAPTQCRHNVARQATEYQRWRDVGCRSRRCRPMPTLGQRRNVSWEAITWTIVDPDLWCQMASLGHNVNVALVSKNFHQYFFTLYMYIGATLTNVLILVLHVHLGYS